MPNWTSTKIEITSREGSSSSLLKFLNHALTHSGVTKEAQTIEEWKQIYDSFSKEPNNRIRLSSFIPMPETFKKYDTTNYPNGNRLELGKEHRLMNGEIVTVTPKLIEAYKKETAYQKKTYGVIGWYDFGCRYWGTKWNADFEVIEVCDDYIELYIETAWSPAEPVFQKMQELCQDLDFTIKYRDEGDCFMGYYETDVEDEDGKPHYFLADYPVEAGYDDDFFCNYYEEDDD